LFIHNDIFEDGVFSRIMNRKRIVVFIKKMSSSHITIVSL
jgi:hypothetical protein